MDMNECRLTVAENIIKLRTAKGWTQLDLGEQLHYSDKSVSKWERGAALPDLLVMKNMAELFGVTVDYFLIPHGEDDHHIQPQPVTNHNAIIFTAIAGIWTLTFLAFIILWLLGRMEWIIPAAAVPVSLIVALVLNCVWRKGRGNVWIVMLLVLSLLLLVCVIFMDWNVWRLLLALIPAEILVWLCFRIRKKH